MYRQVGVTLPECIRMMCENPAKVMGIADRGRLQEEKEKVMESRICKNSEELGKSAAKYIAQILKEAIEEKGSARIVLSTGASQFDTLKALVEEPGIQWEHVEMFHLDEYVDLPQTLYVDQCIRDTGQLMILRKAV